MNLNKENIKIISYRLWWHLSDRSAKDASFDISSMFFNSIKNNYPTRVRKNPNGDRVNILNKKKRDVKFEIGREELIVSFDLAERKFDKEFFCKEIKDCRVKLFQIFEELNIDHTHIHQDVFKVFFHELEEISNLDGALKKIGVNLELLFLEEKRELVNFNISTQYKKSKESGNINYEIASGTNK